MAIAQPIKPLAHRIGDLPRQVGRGRSSIYKAIRAGELKARKLGRSTIVMDDDLRAWLDALPVIAPRPAAAAAA